MTFQDILKDKSFELTMSTSFQDFVGIVCDDKRASTLDPGNVKLTYNSLMVMLFSTSSYRMKMIKIFYFLLKEKVENKEKERLKEENR